MTVERVDDVEVIQWKLPICSRCLNGEGGECHTPGCAFWMCPAPDAEQAERIRALGEIA